MIITQEDKKLFNRLECSLKNIQPLVNTLKLISLHNEAQEVLKQLLLCEVQCDGEKYLELPFRYEGVLSKINSLTDEI